MDTQRDIKDESAQRKTTGGHREKAATCKLSKKRGLGRNEIC